MPKITVYITNHNYGKYLKQSIESIFNQTYQDFELFLIDDSSTDNSKEIIESYRNTPKVNIFYLQNKNHVKNANFALRQAKGKFFMRLDADDWMDPNGLLVLSNYLDQNKNTAAVFPGYFLVNEKGDVTKYISRSKNIIKQEVNDKEPHGACTMFRTNIVRDSGGYNEKIDCQDGLDLWLKLRDSYDFVSLPTALFYYRQHGNNLTLNQNSIEINREFLLGE